ncbi:hypothetical protein P7C70_g812, partial [Phenoliferia sp. Uapishka_3]
MALNSHDPVSFARPLRSRASSPHPSLPSTLLDTSGSLYKAQRDADRPKIGRTTTRPPSASYTERIRRRPRLFGAAFAFILFFWAAWIGFGVTDLIVLFRFKLKDAAYEKGWINGCGLRKKPLLFIRGDDELAVMWETNCDQDILVRFGVEVSKPREKGSRKEVARVDWGEVIAAARTKVPDNTDSHWAYHAILPNLKGGLRYSYKIFLRNSPTSSSPLAAHSFPWLGSVSTSSMSLSAVSDNQYNVRTFHRILLRLLSHSPSPPKLLLHLGDVVQEPKNLAQWQTDFFDPLTTLLRRPFGQSTPILLARGNHDWDSSGANVYTGGSPPRSDWMREIGQREKRMSLHPGTYMSYSPHPRCRILVLDANLDEGEQAEQEWWLEWELKRQEWKGASLKIVMVHVPPFLEYWDKEAWNEGGESHWSLFVRQRLTPLLSLHGTHLVISGHQHAYSRGFLPAALHRTFTSVTNSSALPPFAVASTAERGWEKTPISQREPGTIYTTIGGAGGTLDEDLVEKWGFYEKSVKGRYHFIGMELKFDTVRLKAKEGVRTYRVGGIGRCKGGGAEVVDVLSWKAVDIEGKVFDEFRIEAEGCRYWR